MEWIEIITSLLKLLPVKGVDQIADDAATFGPIVADLITRITSQSGMTTEEIFQRAGVTLDDNKKMLLEDLVRLGVNPTSPGSTPAE